MNRCNYDMLASEALGRMYENKAPWEAFFFWTDLIRLLRESYDIYLFIQLLRTQNQKLPVRCALDSSCLQR